MIKRIVLWVYCLYSNVHAVSNCLWKNAQFKKVNIINLTQGSCMLIGVPLENLKTITNMCKSYPNIYLPPGQLHIQSLCCQYLTNKKHLGTHLNAYTYDFTRFWKLWVFPVNKTDGSSSLLKYYVASKTDIAYARFCFYPFL